MAAQKKIERIIDLLNWLAQCGETGLARQTIIDQYEISEKTLGRDMEEIRRLFRMVNMRYDEDEGRYTCTDSSFLTKSSAKKGKGGSLGSAVDKQFNIFKNRPGLPDDSFILHFGDQDSTEAADQLLEAILEEKSVSFRYKSKKVETQPFFFCYYSDNWYLIACDFQSNLTKKYRLDHIKDAARPLIGEKNLLSGSEFNRYKQELISRIRRSKNIFIDLNQGEKISVTFRFFLDRETLQKELPCGAEINAPEKDDHSVNDCRITFNGFQEAKVFMHKWLGTFQILTPAHIRQRYLDELEEAMDII